MFIKRLVKTKPSDGQSLYKFYFGKKVKLSFSDQGIITAADAGKFHIDQGQLFISITICTVKTQLAYSIIMLKKTDSFSNSNGVQTNSSVSNASTNITCFRCGEFGHKRPAVVKRIISNVIFVIHLVI